MASFNSILDGFRSNLLYHSVPRPFIGNRLSLRLYTESARYTDDIIYISTPSFLDDVIQKNADINVIVFNGDEAMCQEARKARSSRINLAVTSLPFAHLFTILTNIVEQYNRFNRNTIELALQERSIRALFASAAASRAEVALLDANDCIISPAEGLSILPNADYTAAVPIRGAVPPVSVIRREGEAHTVLITDVPDPEEGQSSRLALAYSAYMENVDYHALLLDLREAICQIISCSEYRYWLASSLARFLYEIMERNPSEEEIDAQLDALFGQRSSFYSFAIASFNGIVESDVPEMLQTLQRMIPDSRGTFYEGEIVLMISTAAADHIVAYDEAALSAFLREHGGCILFGNGTSVRRKLRTMFILTQETLRIAMSLRASSNERIFLFGNYSTSLAMRIVIEGVGRLAQDNDVLVLGHPDCVRLYFYDKAHKDYLLDVLYYYLTNNCNYKKTAEVCFMHRNTVVYKVRKIEELLGYSLESCPDLYRILFSAELLRFYQKLTQQKLPDGQLGAVPICMEAEESLPEAGSDPQPRSRAKNKGR